MKKSIILGLAVAVATSISGMAFAQETGGGDAKPGAGKHGGGFARLKKLDTDKDGNVTKEEFGAGIAAKFKELDTDGNGQLSAGEFGSGGRGAAAFERLDRNSDGVINKEDRPVKPAKGGKDKGGPEAGGSAPGDGN